MPYVRTRFSKLDFTLGNNKTHQSCKGIFGFSGVTGTLKEEKRKGRYKYTASVQRPKRTERRASKLMSWGFFLLLPTVSVVINDFYPKTGA